MIVLDACAALEMVRQTVNGKALFALLTPHERIASSALIRAELCSALWQHVRAGSYTVEEAKVLLRRALALVTDMHDTGENCMESLTEAVRLEHSPYDLFYLTLARRLGATLFTLDKQLARLCERQGVDVVWQEDLE